jgi:uncharacterized protein (TIGR04141 family)
MLRHDRAPEDWGHRDVISEFEEIPTEPLGNLNIRLLVRQSDARPPRWLQGLSRIIAKGHTVALLNMHSAALLLVEHAGYRFVIVYGSGRFAVDANAIQPRFGLRVVANSVASSRVKGADTRELGGRSKSQRTVMPSTGPFHELGIEPTKEWVRQMEGRPTIDFANAVAGSDSLKLNIRRFGLGALEAKLDQIIEHYESNAYKTDYAFLDYFRHIQDEALKDQLNGRIAELVASRSQDIDFAAPDIPEPLEVEFYRLRYRRARSNELADLAHDDIYAALDNWRADDPLRQIRVEAFDANGDAVGEQSRRLVDYVAAEVTLDDKRYVLSAGSWFEVDTDFVSQVQQRVEQVVDLSDDLLLEPWSLTDLAGEGAYNEHLAAARQWQLLDKKNLPIGGSYQKVEICDVLTGKKELLCVKRMTQSNTLSHLFMQGLVSAQLLAGDAEGYRAHLMGSLQQMDPDADFGAQGDWTVIFAIATNKSGPLSKSLYFFSKVALDRTVRQLSASGVKVAIARIQIEG